MTETNLPRAPAPPADTLCGRDLATIFSCALIVRLINVALLSGDPANFLFEDSVVYLNEAEGWLRSGGYNLLREEGFVPETERVPIYSLFLAAIFSLFGHSHVVVAIVQGGVDAATCILIALLGGELGRRTGLTAGWLAAVWPNMIIHSAVILTDSLFLFFFSLMLLCVVRFLRGGGLAAAAWSGFFCGLALMTRTVAQFLPFALAAVVPFVVLRHGGGGRMALAAVAVFAAAALAPAAPLIVRNLTKFDTPGLTAQAGSHLLGWVAPLTRSSWDGTPWKRAAADLNKAFADHLAAEGLTQEDLSPFELSERKKKFALAALSRMPVLAVMKAWGQGMAINLGAPAIVLDPRVRGLPHPSFIELPGVSLAGKLRDFLAEGGAYAAIALIGIAGSLVTLVFQAAGFVVLAKRNAWAALFAGLCLAYFLLVSGPVASPKYRLPMEPVLIALLALAVTELLERLRRRRGKAAPRPPSHA